LLGVEELLPVSAFRACTAAVIEIKYKDSPNYGATVQFITEQEWQCELNLLVRDTHEEDGTITKKLLTKSNPTGVAQAKIRAIYGKNGVPKDLNDGFLKKYLGKTIQLSDTPKASDLAHDIEKYVLSYRRKRKNQKKQKKQKRKKGEPKEPKEPKLWPIVKKVTVYGKFKVLKEGAVLVDLPGVSDSNSARENVTNQYMKNCKNFYYCY